MRGSQLLGLVRWEEGIAETQHADDAAGGMQIVGDHAGDPPAHRLAPDDEWPFGFERVDRGEVFRTELFGAGRRLAGRRAAARGHIVEFETGDPEPRVRP